MSCRVGQKHVDFFLFWAKWIIVRLKGRRKKWTENTDILSMTMSTILPIKILMGGLCVKASIVGQSYSVLLKERKKLRERSFVGDARLLLFLLKKDTNNEDILALLHYILSHYVIH